MANTLDANTENKSEVVEEKLQNVIKDTSSLEITNDSVQSDILQTEHEDILNTEDSNKTYFSSNVVDIADNNDIADDFMKSEQYFEDIQNMNVDFSNLDIPEIDIDYDTDVNADVDALVEIIEHEFTVHEGVVTQDFWQNQIEQFDELSVLRALREHSIIYGYKYQEDVYRKIIENLHEQGLVQNQSVSNVFDINDMFDKRFLSEKTQQAIKDFFQQTKIEEQQIEPQKTEEENEQALQYDDNKPQQETAKQIQPSNKMFYKKNPNKFYGKLHSDINLLLNKYEKAMSSDIEKSVDFEEQLRVIFANAIQKFGGVFVAGRYDNDSYIPEHYNLGGFSLERLMQKFTNNDRAFQILQFLLNEKFIQPEHVFYYANKFSLKEKMDFLFNYYGNKENEFISLVKQMLSVICSVRSINAMHSVKSLHDWLQANNFSVDSVFANSNFFQVVNKFLLNNDSDFLIQQIDLLRFARNFGYVMQDDILAQVNKFLYLEHKLYNFTHKDTYASAEEIKKFIDESLYTLLAPSFHHEAEEAYKADFMQQFMQFLKRENVDINSLNIADDVFKIANLVLQSGNVDMQIRRDILSFVETQGFVMNFNSYNTSSEYINLYISYLQNKFGDMMLLHSTTINHDNAQEIINILNKERLFELNFDFKYAYGNEQLHLANMAKITAFTAMTLEKLSDVADRDDVFEFVNAKIIPFIARNGLLEDQRLSEHIRENLLTKVIEVCKKRFVPFNKISNLTEKMKHLSLELQKDYLSYSQLAEIFGNKIFANLSLDDKNIKSINSCMDSFVKYLDELVREKKFNIRNFADIILEIREAKSMLRIEDPRYQELDYQQRRFVSTYFLNDFAHYTVEEESQTEQLAQSVKSSKARVSKKVEAVASVLVEHANNFIQDIVDGEKIRKKDMLKSVRMLSNASKYVSSQSPVSSNLKRQSQQIKLINNPQIIKAIQAGVSAKKIATMASAIIAPNASDNNVVSVQCIEEIKALVAYREVVNNVHHSAFMKAFLNQFGKPLKTQTWFSSTHKLIKEFTEVFNAGDFSQAENILKKLGVETPSVLKKMQLSTNLKDAMLEFDSKMLAEQKAVTPKVVVQEPKIEMPKPEIIKEDRSRFVLPFTTATFEFEFSIKKAKKEKIVKTADDQNLQNTTEDVVKDELQQQDDDDSLFDSFDLDFTENLKNEENELQEQDELNQDENRGEEYKQTELFQQDELQDELQNQDLHEEELNQQQILEDDNIAEVDLANVQKLNISDVETNVINDLTDLSLHKIDDLAKNTTTSATSKIIEKQGFKFGLLSESNVLGATAGAVLLMLGASPMVAILGAVTYIVTSNVINNAKSSAGVVNIVDKEQNKKIDDDLILEDEDELFQDDENISANGLLKNLGKAQEHVPLDPDWEEKEQQQKEEQAKQEEQRKQIELEKQERQKMLDEIKASGTLNKKQQIQENSNEVKSNISKPITAEAIQIHSDIFTSLTSLKNNISSFISATTKDHPLHKEEVAKECYLKLSVLSTKIDNALENSSKMTVADFCRELEEVRALATKQAISLGDLRAHVMQNSDSKYSERFVHANSGSLGKLQEKIGEYISSANKIVNFAKHQQIFANKNQQQGVHASKINGSQHLQQPKFTPDEMNTVKDEEESPRFVM